MPKITVTAAEGVKAKVTKQVSKLIVVTDDAGNDSIVPNWSSGEIVTFASEAREFEVDNVKTRLLVEVTP